MKDDDDRLLPVVRRGSELADQFDSTRRAIDVRDPVTGFFHGVGSKAATKALDRDTAEKEAFTRNVNVQNGAIRAMIDLRNTADDYKAREQLKDEYYKLSVDRAPRHCGAESHAPSEYGRHARQGI